MAENDNPYDADGYLADVACRDAFDKIGRAGRPLTLEELHGPPDLRERQRPGVRKLRLDALAQALRSPAAARRGVRLVGDVVERIKPTADGS